MLALGVVTAVAVLGGIHVMLATVGRLTPRASPLLLSVGYCAAAGALAYLLWPDASGERAPLSASEIRQRTEICRSAGTADPTCMTNAVVLSKAVLSIVQQRVAANSRSGMSVQPGTASGKADAIIAAENAVRANLRILGYGVDFRGASVPGRTSPAVTCGAAVARIDAPDAGTVFGRPTRFVALGADFLWIEMLAAHSDFEAVWSEFCPAGAS